MNTTTRSAVCALALIASTPVVFADSSEPPTKSETPLHTPLTAAHFAGYESTPLVDPDKPQAGITSALGGGRR